MTINHTGQETTLPTMAKSVRKPFLLMTAAPATGHTAPTLHLAREMIKRGFEVMFMSSPEFKESIEKIGAQYHETSGFWPEGTMEARQKLPHGPPQLVFDMEHVFIATIPSRTATLRTALEKIRESDPQRDVVIVSETMSMAVAAFMYGAPLPKGYDKFPKVININNMVMIVSSIDDGPAGMGLPPDATESGRARNKILNDMVSQGPMGSLSDVSEKIYMELGCNNIPPRKVVFDAWLDSYDTCFQMCTPSLEYPRSDLHPSIRFAGALPKRGLDPNQQYPEWWSEVLANSASLQPAVTPGRKKIIPVSQGTVAVNYNELIIPTLRAFADRDDVLLVVILGIKGATLPSDFEIPSNARVIDYLPYDAALEHADVFISNGGYGGVMHGVNNGVPMVLSGITEDKIEVTARAEYAGFAVNLRTQTPSSEQIREGVGRILADPKFKAKAVRLMQENEDMDSLSIIERQIMKYARKE